MKILVSALLAILLLTSGCTANTQNIPTMDADMPVSNDMPAETTQPYVPGENPYSPKPGDASLTKAAVFVDFSQLIATESYPPQIFLALTGTMPTPCHQLRVAISPPNEKNEVYVEAYTVVDPNMICAQVLADFSENIALGTYPPGLYTVFLNGQEVGTFNS